MNTGTLRILVKSFIHNYTKNPFLTVKKIGNFSRVQQHFIQHSRQSKNRPTISVMNIHTEVASSTHRVVDCTEESVLDVAKPMEHQESENIVAESTQGAVAEPKKGAMENVQNETSDEDEKTGKKKKKKWNRAARKRHLRRMEKQKVAEENGAPPKKKKRKKDDFYEQDIFQETSYYFENGLRKVYPYFFTFTTFAKARWFKRTLLDVFCNEFRHFPEHIMREKIKNGEIKVNDVPVGLEYRLTDNDLITHLSHRHEVPVTDEPIQIIHESEEMLVVNKPSSMPCHPCGSFRHNSLIYILWREHGYKGLKFVHRIDRLTSGLLILPKNEVKAAELSQHIAARKVQKEYICRVEGDFFSEKVECREPLGILSFKLGLQKVCADGKEAWTTFEKMSSDGKSSLVRCFPHTGRTHQIRVHLQFLGFPIVNDPLYNSDIWGPNKGKGGDFGKTEEEVIDLMLRDHDKLKYVNADCASVDYATNSQSENGNAGNSESSQVSSAQISSQTECKDHHTSSTKTDSENMQTQNKSDPENSTSVALNETLKVTSVESESVDPSASVESVKDILTSSIDRPDNKNTLDPSKLTFCPNCLDCQRQFKDPRPEELVIFLHARKYTGPDWEFETPLPVWATEDWVG